MEKYHNFQNFESAIIAWICDLKLSETPNSIKDFQNGNILVSILSTIAPKYFDYKKINENKNLDWIDTMKNLNYLYQQLEKYYEEFINKKLP